MDRRRFLKAITFTTAGFFFSFPMHRLLGQPDRSDLVLVSGGSPTLMVRKAVEQLGGMSRFVQPGQTVVVKPNMSWDRSPEFAANTNPEVAAEVVRLCYQAGASKVYAFDRTCNEARRCYRNSGLQEALTRAGAVVPFIRNQLFETVPIKNHLILKEWDFYRPALEADVLINIPVLKHHSLAGLTIGFKNMMGLIGGRRGRIHHRFHRKIVDINQVLRADLTIVDATRVLRRNGPSGGSLADVEVQNKILAGIDPVLVDAWAIKLFGSDPAYFKWIQLGESAGLGSANINRFQPTLLKIKS